MNHTQRTLSKILDIGFRTYVRYEAGDRNIPVVVLIKMARLGNISLDQLIITQIKEKDLIIPDTKKSLSQTDPLDIVESSLNERRLVSRGINDNYFISNKAKEKKLLNFFRMMDPLTREKCLLDFELRLKNHKNNHIPITKDK